MSYTLLAVDDEPPALREIVFALRGCATDSAPFEVLQACDATEALRILRARRIDAVFLDINMPGLTGLELAEVLSQFALPPQIVFVTALEDRAVDAFELGVCDYIVKPFRPERVARAVAKTLDAIVARGQAEPALGRATAASGPTVAPTGLEPTEPVATAQRIAAERGGETRYLAPEDIYYAEANGDYVRLHTGGEHYLVRTPLSELEARWCGEFVRAHRAYLVRLDAIVALRNDGGRHSILVRSKPTAVEIPVSRRNAREIRDAMAHVHPGRAQ